MKNITLKEFIHHCEGYVGIFGDRPVKSLGYRSDNQFTICLDEDVNLLIPMYTDGEVKRFIATIEGDYARDTQIYIGTSPEDSSDSEEWADARHPSLFLGLITAPDEKSAQEKMAEEIECSPEIITLQEI